LCHSRAESAERRIPARDLTRGLFWSDKVPRFVDSPVHRHTTPFMMTEGVLLKDPRLRARMQKSRKRDAARPRASGTSLTGRGKEEEQTARKIARRDSSLRRLRSRMTRACRGRRVAPSSRVLGPSTSNRPPRPHPVFFPVSGAGAGPCRGRGARAPHFNFVFRRRLAAAVRQCALDDRGAIEERE
jgi:hypothetical protein